MDLTRRQLGVMVNKSHGERVRCCEYGLSSLFLRELLYVSLARVTRAAPASAALRLSLPDS